MSAGVLLAPAVAALLVLVASGALSLLVPERGTPLVTGTRERTSPDLLARRVGRLPVAALGRRLDAYTAVTTRLLADAGRRQETPAAFAETHAGLVVVGLASSALVALAGAPVPAFLLLVAVVVQPPLRLFRQARRRQAAVERAMPPFLELLGVLLAAGMTFRHALSRIVSRLEGPLAEEMQMLLTQLEFGWTPEQALAALQDRSSAPTVTRFVTSARQNLALGVPIATVLGDMAGDVRAEYVVALKVRAQQAVDRASVVLVLLVMPAMLGLTATVLVSEALDLVAELGL